MSCFEQIWQPDFSSNRRNLSKTIGCEERRQTLMFNFPGLFAITNEASGTVGQAQRKRDSDFIRDTVLKGTSYVFRTKRTRHSSKNRGLQQAARGPKIMLLASVRRAVFIFPLRSIVADVSRRQCRFVMNRANRRVSNYPKSASECQYCARQNGEFHGSPPAAKHIAAASGTEWY